MDRKYRIRKDSFIPQATGASGDGQFKTCKTCVQNERTGCPKWGETIENGKFGPACGSRECGREKLKVEAVKQNDNMLKGLLITRSGGKK